MSGDPDFSVAYLRRAHEAAADWYRSADAKAQIALTLDGIFVSFITGSLVTRRSDAAEIVEAFGPETWVALAGMVLAIAASLLSAVACLWSRTMSDAELRAAYTEHGVDPGRAATYRPETTLFFQHLAGLDRDELARFAPSIDEGFERTALSSQIVLLSRNVVKKHRWVNRAFALTAAGLACFLAVGASYVVRVAGG